MAEDREDYVPEAESANGRDKTAEEMARLIAENAELRDRALRALADAENLRKRAEREREDQRLYAVTSFARDMLMIADNFQRALDSLSQEGRAGMPAQAKAVLEGVEATERQLMSMLERHGVKRIDTTDAKFDPHLHQAIAEVPGEGRPPGSIVNVVQTGYVIADRLLRPAMVTVAARGSAPAAETALGGIIDTKS
jgi:molecular chaperone GrpE